MVDERPVLIVTFSVEGLLRKPDRTTPMHEALCNAIADVLVAFLEAGRALRLAGRLVLAHRPGRRRLHPAGAWLARIATDGDQDGKRDEIEPEVHADVRLE